MRTMPLFLGLLVGGPLLVLADDPLTKKTDTPPAKKTDYTEFSKLVHGFVTKQAPKQFEHRDGWGATIPLPEKRLPLPNLRTYLKDGDQVVLPHGAWKKLKVKIDDPNKDIKIQVTEFKPIDGKTYRMKLDADVTLRADGEWQQWQKGLLLIGLAVETDAFLNIAVGCDVGVALNFKKIPPEVEVSPKITDLTLDLKDIRGRKGPILTGEKGERLAADIKGLIRGAVKSYEPQMKELANQAILQSIKEGKGTMSASGLLKALPKQE